MFGHDSFGCTVAGKLLGYAMVMNVLAVPTVLGEEQSMCRVFCDSRRLPDLPPARKEGNVLYLAKWL